MRKILLILSFLVTHVAVYSSQIGSTVVAQGVKPSNSAPALWSAVEPVVQKYISSGYTSLVSIWDSVDSVPDMHITSLRKQVFGGVPDALTAEGKAALNRTEGKKSILTLPATLVEAIPDLKNYNNQNSVSEMYGGYNPNYPTISGCFISGSFQPEEDALKEGIKKGVFNNLLYWRLLISEYLIGKLCVVTSGFAISPIFDQTYTDGTSLSVKDADIINTFVTAAKQHLLHLRYLRSAITNPYNLSITTLKSGTASSTSRFTTTATSSQNSTTTVSDATMRYIDSFAGVMVVNKCSSVALCSADKSVVIKQYSTDANQQYSDFIPAAEYCNHWTDQKSDIGPTRVVKYGAKDNDPNLYVSIAQDSAGNLLLNTDSSTTFINLFDGSFFEKPAIQAFFSECAPWAVVMSISQEMQTDTTLIISSKVLGLVKLNQLDFPDALLVKATGSNGSKNYNLNDIWGAVQSLYKLTYSTSSTVRPYAYTLLQGLFNGYLQTDTYQQLVPEVAADYVKDASGKLVKRAVYAHSRWGSPTVNQWLKPDSPLDWKFLRALIVTYNAISLSHVNRQVLGQNPTTKNAYIEDIFANPTQDVDSCFYIGNQFDTTAKAYNYISVVPYVDPVAIAKAAADKKAREDAANKVAKELADKAAADKAAADKKALEDQAIAQEALKPFVAKAESALAAAAQAQTQTQTAWQENQNAMIAKYANIGDVTKLQEPLKSQYFAEKTINNQLSSLMFAAKTEYAAVKLEYDRSLQPGYVPSQKIKDLVAADIKAADEKVKSDAAKALQLQQDQEALEAAAKVADEKAKSDAAAKFAADQAATQAAEKLAAEKAQAEAKAKSDAEKAASDAAAKIAADKLVSTLQSEQIQSGDNQLGAELPAKAQSDQAATDQEGAKAKASITKSSASITTVPKKIVMTSSKIKPKVISMKPGKSKS